MKLDFSEPFESVGSWARVRCASIMRSGWHLGHMLSFATSLAATADGMGGGLPFSKRNEWIVPPHRAGRRRRQD